MKPGLDELEEAFILMSPKKFLIQVLKRDLRVEKLEEAQIPMSPSRALIQALKRGLDVASSNVVKWRPSTRLCA